MCDLPAVRGQLIDQLNGETGIPGVTVTAGTYSSDMVFTADVAGNGFGAVVSSGSDLHDVVIVAADVGVSEQQTISIGGSAAPGMVYTVSLNGVWLHR